MERKVAEASQREETSNRIPHTNGQNHVIYFFAGRVNRGVEEWRGLGLELGVLLLTLRKVPFICLDCSRTILMITNEIKYFLGPIIFLTSCRT